MGADPLTAGMGLASQAIGTKQLGGQAPGVVPTEGPAGMLGQLTPELIKSMAEMPATNPVQDAMQGVQQAPQQQVGPPEEPQGLMGPPEVAPAAPEKAGGMGGLLGDFIGGIDKGFQSPATLLGVGLLNQQKSGLGTLGLGALGAYNAFKNRG